MPLSTDETELLALIQMALTDAYPGRRLAVDAQPHMVGWLNIVVTETGKGRAREIRMPVKRDKIKSRLLKDLRDQLMGDVVMQLGQPGRVA
jgi:hypothetical protein